MIYLLYIIISIEIITIIYNLIKFLLFKSLNAKNIKLKNEYNNDKGYQINILIPCYKEIKVIKNTIEHFENIIKKHDNIELYIVTTEKEKIENNKATAKTTYEYLQNLEICNKKHTHLIHYPRTEGMMADQLNYAINEILSDTTYSTDKIYFSVYNADSNPDISTFSELNNKIISLGFPPIFQQYSNYFLNYNSQNFLMKGFSIYQTAFEFRNGLINNAISNYLYSHVVGHGLIIRGDYIEKLGGFNSDFWCEDIYLTGLLHNNNEAIIPLNSLDNAQNPENFKIQIIQNAVWFKTASHHVKILRDIKKNNQITLSGLIWLLHEFRATFVWIFMPLFLIYSFIYPLLIKNYILLLLSILVYSAFIYVNYFLNLIIINKNRFKKYIKNYFSCFIAILFTGFGPIYSIFLKKKVKTER